MSESAVKLAKHLNDDARAKLEAVRLDLNFKFLMYKQQIKQLETMMGFIAEGIEEVKTQIAELSDGTQAD